MNTTTLPTESWSNMPLAHRQALLTVLRYELREGRAAEEVANRHNLSVEFVKAIKPKQHRRTKAEMQAAREGDPTRRDLAEQLQTLENTVYELIDLVHAFRAVRR